jgi:hypothetical protein
MSAVITRVGSEEASGADETAACPEHQREANHPKRDTTDRVIHHVFHQDVDDVLRAGEPCLHEGETGLHPKHENGGDDHPQQVHRIIASLAERRGFDVHFCGRRGLRLPHQ